MGRRSRARSRGERPALLSYERALDALAEWRGRTVTVSIADQRRQSKLPLAVMSGVLDGPAAPHKDAHYRGPGDPAAFLVRWSPDDRRAEFILDHRDFVSASRQDQHLVIGLAGEVTIAVQLAAMDHLRLVPPEGVA